MTTTDITSDLQRVEGLVREAIAKSKERHPDRPRRRRDPAPAIERDLFQPNDDGRVATQVTTRHVCAVCENDVCGELITLIEYGRGRNLYIHTVEGHRLHYRGRVLLRVECHEPLTIRRAT